MIVDPVGDLLSALKAGIPDPGKLPLRAREEFTSLYVEFQEIEQPKLERVVIRDGLDGFWITVPESLPERTVLFFHGGGFSVGSTRDHIGLCTNLARACHARVFSVDYRLAPEHVFPAAANDALCAYQYLLAQGIPPRYIIPVGISAGGTLVLDLLISARDAKMALPHAAVCLSPITDLQFSGESVERNSGLDWITPLRLHAIRSVYLAGKDQKDPLASPVQAALNGLPRLYIQIGTHELLLSDVAAFVQKARWAGSPVQLELWEGMFHCWQVFARDIPEAKRAIEHIGSFVQDALNR
ncbi:MAG: alpha/beta hydrolase [Methanomicrobiales archaeon HGW-Methanomicrobiales-5]|nr:MAG: alpha/beta hydrolase [Methanomicrobiales archaeon HGW-Methanomicrobiales-5]